MGKECTDKKKKKKNEGPNPFVSSLSKAPRLTSDNRFIELLPIILWISVVILVVRYYPFVPLGGESYFFANSDVTVDFFSHYKVVIMCVALILVLILFIYRLSALTFYIRKTWIYLPLAAFLFLTILSFIFAEYKDIAFWGFNERFEGTLVFFAYAVMFFYIVNTVRSERDFKIIIYFLAATSILLSLLGLSQFIDHDFFRTGLGQKLLSPSELWPYIDQAVSEGRDYFEFTFKNREIYQTVYNINYVGFYLTLLLPLWMMMFFHAQKLSSRIFWLIVFGLNFINLIGAASAAGLIGISAEFIFAIVFLNKKILRWWKSLIFIVAVMIICMSVSADFWWSEVKGIVNIFSEQIIGDQVFKDKNTEETEEENAAEVESASEESATEESSEQTEPDPANWSHYIKYLITKGDSLEFDIDNAKGVIKIATKAGVTEKDIKATSTSVYKLYDVTAFDSKNNEIKLNKEEVKGDDGSISSINYTFPEKKVKKKVPYFTLNGKLPKKHAKTKTVTEVENKYQSLTLMLRQQDESRYLSLILSSDDFAWHFDINKNSKLKFFNPAGKLIDLRDIKYTKFFKGKENMFSGRGYIWSRAFPLVSNTLFIGHGADTLPFYYPQDDYVGKYNARWKFGTIVDKPHSLYVALAVNNGVLALAFYLLLLLMFLIQGIRIYWKHFPKDFISYTGLGIFFGVIGFTISAISNDSTVSVMPLFYGLLALGFTANLILKKRFADEEKELAEKGIDYKEYEKKVLDKEKSRRKKIKAEKKAIKDMNKKNKKPSALKKLTSKLSKKKKALPESDESVLDKAKKK